MESILIPSLPNDVSLQILARIPRQYYSETICNVSSSWREAATSPQLFSLRKQLGVTESWFYTAVQYSNENRSFLRFYSKNTSAGDSEWQALPLMGEDHRPFCGFSCAVIGELLFVIGGCEWRNNCTKFPATNKVSIFNARTNQWTSVQSMKYARARFGCGVVDGKLYVAGGYRFIRTSDESDDEDFWMYQHIVEKCQRSAEVYDPLTDAWTPVADMIYIDYFVRASVMKGKFVVRGYNHEDQIIQVFQAEENRWVKNTESISDPTDDYEIWDDFALFYKSTTIEDIGEDGEKRELEGSPMIDYVVISI